MSHETPRNLDEPVVTDESIVTLKGLQAAILARGRMSGPIIAETPGNPYLFSSEYMDTTVREAHTVSDRLDAKDMSQLAEWANKAIQRDGGLGDKSMDIHLMSDMEKNYRAICDALMRFSGSDKLGTIDRQVAVKYAARYSAEQFEKFVNGEELDRACVDAGLDADMSRRLKQRMTNNKIRYALFASSNEPVAAFDRIARGFEECLTFAASQDPFAASILNDDSLLVEAIVAEPTTYMDRLEQFVIDIKDIRAEYPSYDAPMLKMIIHFSGNRKMGLVDVIRSIENVRTSVERPPFVSEKDFIALIVLSGYDVAESRKRLAKYTVQSDRIFTHLESLDTTKDTYALPVADRLRRVMDSGVSIDAVYLSGTKCLEFANAVITVCERLKPSAVAEITAALSTINRAANESKNHMEAYGSEALGSGYEKSLVEFATKIMVALAAVINNTELPAEMKSKHYIRPEIKDCFEALHFLEDIAGRGAIVLSGTDAELLNDSGAITSYVSPKAHAMLQLKPYKTDIKDPARELGRSARLNMAFFQDGDAISENPTDGDRGRAASLRIDLEDGTVATDICGWQTEVGDKAKMMTTVFALGDYLLTTANGAEPNYYHMRGQYDQALTNPEMFAAQVRNINSGFTQHANV
jgi:hypothetical protein